MYSERALGNKLSLIMIDRYKYFDEQEICCLKLNIISALLALIIFVVDLQVPLGVAGGVPYIMV